MTKHIILWQLKDDIEDKAAVKAGIKQALEGLMGKIPGLLSVEVRYDLLDSSNAEVMLDTTFESPEALKAYSVHPEHVKAADGFVRPYTRLRVAADYEIS